MVKIGHFAILMVKALRIVLSEQKLISVLYLSQMALGACIIEDTSVIFFNCASGLVVSC